MRHALGIALLLALLTAAPAGGYAPTSVSPDPWATVNVCDTTEHPNQMGIRGGMPGLARRTAMHMRFRVQFRDRSGRWRLIARGADSGRQRVAAGRRGEHDAGWTFEFMPPASGGAYVLRGVVVFEWRRGRRVLERVREVTEAGHPGTAGAEPEDFSAATCEIA